MLGPINTKGGDVLAQNVFSQQQIIIQLWKLPLQLACQKTSGCTEFGPQNTKESDVLAQNGVFSETDHHTALKLVPL